MGKITKWSILLANLFFEYLKGACLSMSLIFFRILCIVDISGKFELTITERSFRIEHFDLGTRFTSYGVPLFSL